MSTLAPNSSFGPALWQSLVAYQLSLVGRQLPASLTGGIRFHAANENKTYFLKINGPATTFVRSLDAPGTTVEINEDALAELLSGRDSTLPAFDVAGDVELFQSFFTALKRLFVPTSSLAMREARLQPRGL